MIPLEEGRDNASDDATTERPSGSDAGPPPETVSGIVRVSGLREEAAAAISPTPAPVLGDDDVTPTATELAAATFPTAWRGYDPTAVDQYVRRVAQTITALEETRTPQDVVRRALDRVGEETAAILREAEEAAQRITTKSRSDAAERVQKAEREAHEITQRARARLRDLDADIDRIWIERQRIIDDIRKLGDRLSLAADQAEERYPAEDFDPAPPAPGKPALTPVPTPSDDQPTQSISRTQLEGNSSAGEPARPQGDGGGEPPDASA